MRIWATAGCLGLACLPRLGLAADACNGMEFRAGRITLGRALTAENAGSPETKACLKQVAQEVGERRLIRSVTVSVRVPDAQRLDGKALALAKSLGDELVTAGVPRNRVFGLAPRTEPSEPVSIQLAYTERAPENVVATLAAVDGDVRIGEKQDSLKPARAGAPVLGNELLQTGRASAVWIRLKDGSGLKLEEYGLLQLLQMEINGTERQVKAELLKGQIETDVKRAAAGSTFETSTRSAVASVRGTSYRMAQPEDGPTRLETLQGTVGLAGKKDGVVGQEVPVPAGQGASVSAAGTVSAPKGLLVSPVPASPLKGPAGALPTLTWASLPGAAQYRVELARDADFTVSKRVLTSAGASVAVAERLPTGKWFWRVAGVDADGFQGASSRIYAFTVVE